MGSQTLATTWIELQKVPQDSPEAESMMWAAEELNSLTLDSPSDCWYTVLEILELTDDDWVLTNLGTGPLENLLVLEPQLTIDLIEAALPAKERLARALNDVWQSLMPDEVWNQLQRLTAT